MQLIITLAIVTFCAMMLGRGLLRSLAPGLVKGKRSSSCGCAGGCPALKNASTGPQPPVAMKPGEHRPAA